ncbi:uncharacterized protein LOC113303310 [Papaver somniferum]|uniref:uncharacterized protein LOC113303310 n=1 Tax=Papaver somniferum TaxID=3469 RepID=UPI000E705984|nr:uncharacterized protein LOC113303310 [Papaver somniferum]
MEYPTDQKLSEKGRDGHLSGKDTPKMKVRTSWGKFKDYYDIIVKNNPRALQSSFTFISSLDWIASSNHCAFSRQLSNWQCKNLLCPDSVSSNILMPVQPLCGHLE